MGGLDTSLLNYKFCSATSDFYNKSMACSFLQPLIVQPTRVAPLTQTLIDNIFSNNIRFDSISGNVTCAISNHFIPFSIFLEHSIKFKKKSMWGISVVLLWPSTMTNAKNSWTKRTGLWYSPICKQFRQGWPTNYQLSKQSHEHPKCYGSHTLLYE